MGMGYVFECVWCLCVCVCTELELLCVTETCSHELERTDQQRYDIPLNAAVKFPFSDNL